MRRRRGPAIWLALAAVSGFIASACAISFDDARLGVGGAASSSVSSVSSTVSSSSSSSSGGATCPPTVMASSSSSSSTSTSSGGFTVGTLGVIAAGEAHSCAIVDGGVSCWGRDDHGQLGNGTMVDAKLPVPVSPPLSGVQAVVASDHTCAIVNGGAYCWGYNFDGELGNGLTCADYDGGCTGGAIPASSSPVPVMGLSAGVESITVTKGATCAIVDGAAYCWGSDAHGALGNGRKDGDQPTPMLVATLGSDVQALASGSAHTCALTGGDVFCWGSNTRGQIGDGLSDDGGTADDAWTPVQVQGLNYVQAIAAGNEHSCAIVNGGVLCWGSNSNGQIGNGVPEGGPPMDQLLPAAVMRLSSGVQAIAAGGSHTCAIVAGDVFCWGSNSDGQLGNGTAGVNEDATADSAFPVAVVGLPRGAQAIIAGDTHTCALVDGSVWCWGGNVYGDLGNGSTTMSTVPVRVSGIAGGLEAMAAGGTSTCAVVSGGVRCWGGNASGQLGDGDLVSTDAPTPVLGLSSGVQAVAVGYAHACALMACGVECWGDDRTGELGDDVSDGGISDGGPRMSSMPVPVEGLPSGVQAIAAGGAAVETDAGVTIQAHSCALVDGYVMCWGSNGYGQLGNQGGDSPIPIRVPGLAGVTAVATGARHTCAIASGTVSCWGDNSLGQLGDDSTVPSATPSPVPLPSEGVQLLAAGKNTTCAVMNGAAWCWGDNGGGQLGVDAGASSAAPVEVSGLASGVQAIGVGAESACALVNGAVWCWGLNTSGQVGDGLDAGTAPIAYVPTLVAGLDAGVQGLAVGGAHACAFMGANAVCWGLNTDGQLGTGDAGTGAESLVPVPVGSWR